MNPFSRNCSKLRRFIAEHLDVTSTTMPATFLVIAGLAALIMLANSACGSSASETPPDRTRPPSTPTDAPTPTVTLMPIPTLLPPVMLEEPEDGARLPCESDVELRWSCPDPLGEDERYRLTVKGPDPSVVQCDKSCFTLDEPPPGEYNWTVAVVRSSSGRAVSKEAGWYSFKVLPSPVVHSISPTRTVQGASVPVVLSGENFTHSVALTIGVPLHAAFVSSSEITATIPMTMKVGVYPVNVKDLMGKGESSVIFTVEEVPPPTVEPVPDDTPTPALIYPAPILRQPENGAHFGQGTGVELGWDWEWEGQLGEDEYFAVRVYPRGSAGHSVTWTRATAYRVALYGKPDGDYCWHVVVLRGTGSEDWVALSPESEEWCFYATWPSEPSDTKPNIDDIPPGDRE